MKRRKNWEPEPQTDLNLPDIKIIDLDREPVSHLMDKSPEVRQEEEEAFISGETIEFKVPLEEVEPEEERDFITGETEELNAARIQAREAELEKERQSRFSTEEDEVSDRKPFPINLHFVFLAAALCIVFLIGWRITHFGTHVNPDDYESPDFQGDTLDSIFPFLLPEDMENPADDGVTNIVAFGNAPFADDKGSEDNLANMIAELTDSTVYNCSFPNSYLAASGEPLVYAPQDAFNFYWMVLAVTVGEVVPTYETLFQDENNHFSEEDLETFRTLLSIDFNKVDIVVILYDASDYLAGHEMYNDNNDTDIKQFTGNLVAGIDLIKQYYPHIQIIVMSPPYAHAVNEKGEYVSSESYRYGWDTLSTYVIKEGEYVYHRGVSFVDNLYGTIDESNADKYLIDNLHLTVEGRRAIAERFYDILHYFDSLSDEKE